ncbi:hypothetical protein Ga0074812_15222 [Parafrankia irregularis]|uniref:Uncharacterized protein n=1 Tax=Parafrankia irregularis TaxID=795642 RepID=A0A0S4QZJ8_9ACTN|nr:hypothetical protein Ga0074812_15222 [Parafrankia irregularis]
MIVGVPGEEGSDWLTYHLQPPGGGEEWSAAADASTLQSVSDVAVPPLGIRAGAIPAGDATAAGACAPGKLA